MNEELKSDTPETDAFKVTHKYKSPSKKQWEAHAKQLERQRDEARRENAVELAHGKACAQEIALYRSDLATLRTELAKLRAAPAVDADMRLVLHSVGSLVFADEIKAADGQAGLVYTPAMLKEAWFEWLDKHDPEGSTPAPDAVQKAAEEIDEAYYGASQIYPKRIKRNVAILTKHGLG